MSYGSFYLAAVCAVVITVTVVYFGFTGDYSPQPSHSEWCKYADRLLKMSPQDSKLMSSMYFLPLALSHCDADDPFYSDLLRRSDSFYDKIASNTQYVASLEQGRDNNSLPVEPGTDRADFLDKFAVLTNNNQSSNISNSSFIEDINSQVQLFCPSADVTPFADRALNSGDYSGKSLLLSISSFYRRLSSICPNSISTYRAQSQLLNLTAPAFAIFFSVDVLSSEAYLKTNLFQARVGREDINATLVSLKALYAKVNDTSRVALLRIAGGLRLGFTSSYGTRSQLLRRDVEIVKMSTGNISQPFIIRIEAVMNQSDFFLAGTVDNPTASVNLTEDDLSQWRDIHLDSDIQVSDSESDEESDDSEESGDEEEAQDPVTVEDVDADYDHVTDAGNTNPDAGNTNSTEAANETTTTTEAPAAPARRWFWF